MVFYIMIHERATQQTERTFFFFFHSLVSNTFKQLEGGQAVAMYRILCKKKKKKRKGKAK